MKWQRDNESCVTVPLSNNFGQMILEYMSKEIREHLECKMARNASKGTREREKGKMRLNGGEEWEGEEGKEGS